MTTRPTKEEIININKVTEPVDYHGNNIYRKIYLWSSAVSFIICTIVILIRLLVFRRIDCLVYGVTLSFFGSTYLLEGKFFKKLKNIVIGIIMLFLSLILIMAGLVQ